MRPGLRMPRGSRASLTRLINCEDEGIGSITGMADFQASSHARTLSVPPHALTSARIGFRSSRACSAVVQRSGRWPITIPFPIPPPIKESTIRPFVPTNVMEPFPFANQNVGDAGVEEDADLAAWIALSLRYVSALPPKKPKAPDRA